MILITKEIEQAFEKQGDTSEKSAKDIKIICKLFGGGACSWYLYEKIDEDIYMAFVTLGDPICAECGRVSLSELKSVKFPPFGLGVERDRYFGNHTLEEVSNTIRNGGHV